MSGDPDQDYFADGISEDLITGLSRVRWLFVIARNSTFVYKGRAVDIREVARKLGVRDALEGSVRRAGQRLRVSAQLIDAVTGGHHWAEQYDRDSATSLQYRMRSPAASSPRSSRACWLRKAFAHFCVRPAIAPGSWWRARRRMSGGSIDRTMKLRSTLSTAPSTPIRITRRPGACSGFAWCFQPIMAGSIATTA